MTQLQIPYPVQLTDRDWQKKKGVANKARKTGVGATLADLDRSFGKSAFTKLDTAAISANTLDPLDFEQRVTAARKTVAAAAQQLKPKFAAAEGKINAAVPGFAEKSDQSVRKHLEVMRALLATLRNRITDDVADELEQALRAEYRARLLAEPAVAVAIANGTKAQTAGKALLGQITAVEADPRVAMIKKTWGGNKGLANRDLSTWCTYWTRLAAKRFPLSTKKLYPGNPEQTVLAAPWVSDVGDEDGGTASTKLKTMVARDSDGEAIDEDVVVVQFCRDYRKSVIDAAPFVRAVARLGATLEKYTA